MPTLAPNRGLRFIEGEVLGDNAPMLALVRSLGFTIRTSPEDPGVQVVSKELQA